MSSFYEIIFLPEGTTDEFYGSEGNKYQLDDGTFLKMRAAPVWCRTCQEVTEGEHIEPLAEIDQQLADYRNEESLLYQFAEKSLAGPGFRAQMIAETERRRNWRETRIAGPKCLSCGTTDVLVLPLGNEIQRPDHSGTLIMKFVGLANVAVSDGLFSAEGDRLTPAPKPSI